MAAEFQLSILTPERTVFEGAVEYVQIPGSEGYMGVLAKSSLPGAAVVGRALKESDRATNYSAGMDSISHE